MTAPAEGKIVLQVYADQELKERILRLANNQRRKSISEMAALLLLDAVVAEEAKEAAAK